MLDTTQLKAGDLCLYKTTTLIYQHTVAAAKPYHVFHTRKGREQRLSETEARKNVWMQIGE